MAEDPYSRLYWRLSDEYPDIWDDAALLGAYVQLLVPADMAWPSKPHRPALVDPDAYARLVECGLVEEEGQRYTVRGLDKHRRRRQRAGRTGARERWRKATAEEDAEVLSEVTAQVTAMQSHSDRTDDRTAIGMPSRAKPSQDEPRRDKTRRTAREKTRGKNGPEHIGDVLGSGVVT